MDNANVFLEKGIDIENRVIHLFGEIEAGTIGEVIRGIQLMAIKSKEPINIYINTFGGCPYSSFALYDFMRGLHEIVFRTFNIGCAMSGGTIIFLAGDERYAYKNSVYMFHTVSSIAEGKLHELIDESAECQRIFQQMIDIYSTHSQLATKDWKRRLKYHNIYMRAEEALKVGLIQGVIE